MNPSSRTRRLLRSCAVALALQLLLSPPAWSGEKDSTVVERGKFILYKFENPIGEEAYRTLRVGDSLTVYMNFAFTDRGTLVPLTATFRSYVSLMPQHFVIKGIYPWP